MIDLKSQRRMMSIKHGWRTRIDLRARERLIGVAFPELFEKRTWLPQGSEELKAACYCAAVFLQDVMGLIRLDLWNNLQHSGGLLPPLPSAKDLAAARQDLESSKPSMDDLIAGMDLGTRAVEIMHAEFLGGKFHPDKDWDIDEIAEKDREDVEEDEYDEREERRRERDRDYARYKCAALLPVLFELAHEVWPSLKKRIEMSNLSRERSDSK